MKTRLSSYPFRIAIPAILVASFSVFVIILRISYNNIFEPGEFRRLLLDPLIWLVVALGVFRLTFRLFPRVEYDENTLYIGRGNRVKAIPFSQAVYIRDVMPISLSPKWIMYYVLRYRDASGKLRRLYWRRQWLNVDYNDAIERFIVLIRKKNPAFIFKF